MQRQPKGPFTHPGKSASGMGYKPPPTPPPPIQWKQPCQICMQLLVYSTVNIDDINNCFDHNT